MHYEAKFIATADDLVAASRMHNRQSDDYWKHCVFVGVLIALVFEIPAYLTRSSQLAFMGICLVPLAFIPLVSEWDTRRVARKIPQEELSYSLSEEGVEFSSSVVRSKVSWDLFTKASIDERGLLLYTTALSYSFIPARAFTNRFFPRQELKEFLTKKLKDADPATRANAGQPPS